MSFAKSDYFYFWSDSYTTPVDIDGSTFVLMNLKTSNTGKFDILVEDKIISKDYVVFSDEITQFPITITGKYTKNKNDITVCALKKDNTQFQNVICSKINLVK